MESSILLNVWVVVLIGSLWAATSFFCLRHKWKESRSCCLSDLLNTAVTGITLAITASVMISLVEINTHITNNIVTNTRSGDLNASNIDLSRFSALLSKLESSNQAINSTENRLQALVEKIDNGKNIPDSELRLLKGAISFECNGGDGYHNCRWTPGQFNP
jgi:hypothetical protein